MKNLQPGGATPTARVELASSPLPNKVHVSLMLYPIELGRSYVSRDHAFRNSDNRQNTNFR